MRTLSDIDTHPPHRKREKKQQKTIRDWTRHNLFVLFLGPPQQWKKTPRRKNIALTWITNAKKTRATRASARTEKRPKAPRALALAISTDLGNVLMEEAREGVVRPPTTGAHQEDVVRHTWKAQ